MIGVGLHIENEESKFGQEGLLDHEENLTASPR